MSTEQPGPSVGSSASEAGRKSWRRDANAQPRQRPLSPSWTTKTS